MSSIARCARSVSGLLLVAMLLAGCGRSAKPACDSARTQELLALGVHALITNAVRNAYDRRNEDGSRPGPVAPPEAPPPMPPELAQAIDAHRPQVMLRHWRTQVAARLHAVRPAGSSPVMLGTQLDLDNRAVLRRALPVSLTEAREVPPSADDPPKRRICQAKLLLGPPVNAAEPLWVRFHVNEPSRRRASRHAPAPGPLFTPVNFLDAGPQLEVPKLTEMQHVQLMMLGIASRRAPPPQPPAYLVQRHAFKVLAANLDRISWRP